jgi:hypothetical protein
MEAFMGKYGNAAVRAVRTYRDASAESIIDAWESAVAEVFPQSRSSQIKGCPRGTFLGICESGLVEGVPAGAYTKSAKNKVYGMKAVALLRKNPEYSDDPVALWEQVMAGETKVPNHQMDVVTSLWRNGLIREQSGTSSSPADKCA